MSTIPEFLFEFGVIVLVAGIVWRLIVELIRHWREEQEWRNS